MLVEFAKRTKTCGYLQIVEIPPTSFYPITLSEKVIGIARVAAIETFSYLKKNVWFD